MGRGRKKGRQGAKHKRHDNDDSTQKISKRKSTPKKRDSTDIQNDTSLEVSPGPFHDLTPDTEITEVRSKDGEKKVKKVGLGGFLNHCARHLLLGSGTIPAPMTPARKLLYPLKG